MAEKRDDGGSVFGTSSLMDPITGTRTRGATGLTVRDWFAGQAMLLAGAAAIAKEQADPGSVAVRIPVAVDAAYAIADAMLEARKQ